MSKSKLGFVPFESLAIDLDRNPRDADNYDIDGLSVDIEQNGLQTPLCVSQRADGTFHLLRGHRRALAIRSILERNPKAAEAFKKVAAVIYEGLSTSEELDLVLDHSNQKNLTRKSEMYRTVASLLRNGFSELAIAIKCDALFARMTNKEPDGRAAALKLTDPSERAAALKDVWRGRIQELHNIVRLPCVVEEHWLRQNGVPDADNAFQCPKLTTARIQKLYTAHLADKKAEAEIDDYAGGPAFDEKWQVFVSEDKKKASGESTTTKRLSASDIEEKQAVFRSKAIRNALGMCIGEDVEMDALDRICTIAECISDRAPDLWKQCVAKYDEIRTADRKKAAEAKAAKEQGN